MSAAPKWVRAIRRRLRAKPGLTETPRCEGCQRLMAPRDPMTTKYDRAVKASGIKVGDLVQWEDMCPPPKFWEQHQARVADFWHKHGETTVGLDNGEWRYLSEVRKV